MQKKIILTIILYLLIIFLSNQTEHIHSQNSNNIKYYTEIDKVYKITDNEKAILDKHKYVICSNRKYSSPAILYDYLKTNDLSAFITVDSILYAFHISYQKLLIDIESAYLYERLYDILNGIRNMLPSKKGSVPQENLYDIDLYTTLLLKLLWDDGITSILSDKNVDKKVDELIGLIKNESAASVTLFGSEHRLDFGLFKPRSHYVKYKYSQRYYKTIISLSCLSFHMIDKKGQVNLRGIRDIYFLTSLLKESNTMNAYKEFRTLIEYFIGTPDFLSPLEIEGTMRTIKNISNKKDALTLIKYLKAKYKDRNIVDEEIYSASEKKAYSFALLDRISPIDTKALNNLIFNNVLYKKKPVQRFYPKGLDVAYVLGNKGARIFLKEELKKYPYNEALEKEAKKISRLNASFWDKSIYNIWLGMIKDIYDPGLKSNEHVPDILKLDSWNKKIINSQLSSWAHLRHDTQAYVKEPNPGPLCEIVDAYLEPCLAVYERLHKLGSSGDAIIKVIAPKHELLLHRLQEEIKKSENNQNITEVYYDVIELIGLSESDFMNVNKDITSYFNELKNTSKYLMTIASKELKGQSLISDESDFLRGVTQLVSKGGGYKIPRWNGWYIRLFYKYNSTTNTMSAAVPYNPYMEFCPTIVSITKNSNGNAGVLHAATGYIKLGFFLLDYKDAEKGAKLFCGPVNSYYEFIYPGKNRLDDNDWIEAVITENDTYYYYNYTDKKWDKKKKIEIKKYIEENSGNNFIKGVATEENEL